MVQGGILRNVSRGYREISGGFKVFHGIPDVSGGPRESQGVSGISGGFMVISGDLRGSKEVPKDLKAASWGVVGRSMEYQGRYRGSQVCRVNPVGL